MPTEIRRNDFRCYNKQVILCENLLTNKNICNKILTDEYSCFIYFRRWNPAKWYLLKRDVLLDFYFIQRNYNICRG